ncbi:MAG: hypothetical protein K2H21_04860 [Muribaculaceae bacterium]|nr:hypothetical protein [Muribaculaceae bacterium]
MAGRDPLGKSIFRVVPEKVYVRKSEVYAGILGRAELLLLVGSRGSLSVMVAPEWAETDNTDSAEMAMADRPCLRKIIFIVMWNKIKKSKSGCKNREKFRKNEEITVLKCLYNMQ